MTNYRITDGFKTFYMSIVDWEEELLDEIIVDHCELKFCDEIDVHIIIATIEDPNSGLNYCDDIKADLIMRLKSKFGLRP